jgi:hypothetical protein
VFNIGFSRLMRHLRHLVKCFRSLTKCFRKLVESFESKIGVLSFVCLFLCGRNLILSLSDALLNGITHLYSLPLGSRLFAGAIRRHFFMQKEPFGKRNGLRCKRDEWFCAFRGSVILFGKKRCRIPFVMRYVVLVLVRQLD